MALCLRRTWLIIYGPGHNSLNRPGSDPLADYKCCRGRLLKINLNQSGAARISPRSLRVVQRGCKPNDLKANREIVAKAKTDMPVGSKRESFEPGGPC